MSTILNTLKKLEEEKSVLEKNIDLKGLLLQGQDSAYPKTRQQTPRTWGLLAGLTAGGALLGGLVLYFFLGPKTVSSGVEKPYSIKNAPAIPEVKEPQEKVLTSPGIPLARIAKAPPEEEFEDPYMDDEFFGPEGEFPVMAEDAPLVEVEEAEPEGAAEIREIENLIETATAQTEIASGVQSSGLGESASSLTVAQAIPGLNLRGIIFFSPNNPANHVFVATQNESNTKLKVGDTVLGATLETIEAQKAVFSYGGQLVETPIGK